MSVAVAEEAVGFGSLEENEQVIERGIASFVEVGQALARVRDGNQYVEAGFQTFEDYCRERWDLTASYAGALCGGAQVATIVATEGLPAPEREWTARPLVKVLNKHGEEAVVTTWRQIVEAHDGDGPITGREVARHLKSGGGANYGNRPSWHELLGGVGDTLTRAEKQLVKLEQAINRKPSDDLRDRAGKYAERAEQFAARLRGISS